MKVPQLARYNGTVLKAYSFVKENITEFPINPLNLISKFKWGLLTYEQMSLKQGCSIDDICECFGTDGYSIYNGQNYTIAYNNKQSHGRINFTLAHEIGHIILNHHKDFDVTSTLKDNFTKEEYKILENEANCFARNILSPAPLVKQMNFWNILFDMPNYFDITLKATTTRISFLNNDLYYLTDEQIKDIQSIFYLYKRCNICNCYTNNLSDLYCKICGNKLINGDGFKMKKYEGIYTLVQCPNCENVDIHDGDEYCIICGKSLKNYCSACNNILSNNARYCSKCGGKSLYFQSGELEDITHHKGVLLSQDEQITCKNWKIILENLKRAKRMLLYTNLLHSNLVVVNTDIFRN